MSFIQNDPRLVQSQQGVSNNTLQQGSTQGGEVSPDAQNAPSNVNSGSSPSTYEAPKVRSSANSSAPRSGMFTNLRNYVDKNQGASSSLASSVGEAVQKKQDAAKQNIENVQNRYSSNVDQQSLQNRDTAVQEVSQRTRETGGLKEPVEVPQVQDQQQDAPAVAPQVTSADDNRIQDIFNAKYTGPRNLYETSGFAQAKQTAQDSQQLIDQSKSPAQFRDLLSKTVAAEGKTYTSGQKNLDELLFGGQQAQEMFNSKTADMGSTDSILNQANADARQLASQTDADTQRVRQEARASFNDLSSERQDQIDDRLSNVVEGWDTLPDYYKDVFRNSTGGDINLSGIEAQTLGLKGGENLFDIVNAYGADSLIGTNQADINKLISTDEQSQLANLQNIAELAGDYGNENSGIDFLNSFTDAEKAGTQTALDSINTDTLQSKLQEALGRGQQSLGQRFDVIGKGKKKYSTFTGNKTKRATAAMGGSLGDVLNKDFVNNIMGKKAEDIQLNQDLSGIKDIARYYQQAEDAQFNQATPNSGTVDGTGNIKANTVDATTGSTFDDIREVATSPGAALADYLGMEELGRILDPSMLLNDSYEMFDNASDKLGVVGDVIFDPLKNIARAGEDITNFFGIGGGGRHEAIAKERAQRDAQSQLQDALTNKYNQSGLNNNINVVRNAETIAREQKLLDILKGVDKTNL